MIPTVGGAKAAQDRLVQTFRSARRDPALAVLEGFHALKHALRFGAEVVEAVTADLEELRRLAGGLAGDLERSLPELVVPVSSEVLAALTPHPPRTGVIAIARRPAVDPRRMLDQPGPGPVVLLEDPRNLGNMGACVRVAAAADAAGVLTTGHNDPWHPDALRGAAGLHFALPVARVAELPINDRALIAVDPEGDTLLSAALSQRAILAFGTERYGLSDALLARADARMRIPMREGVSSLNLATSVTAVLFARRPGAAARELESRFMEQPDADPPTMAYHQRVVAKFRAHGGRVGGWFEGVPLLLLHHIGARSGKPKVTPLVYQDLGGPVAIFASNSGAPSHPGWYRNLSAQPTAAIEVGGGSGTTIRVVTARVAAAAERQEIWERQKEISPVFADYESRTDRRIPVVILDPVGPNARSPVARRD